jgi:hypothetical protein
MDIFRQSDKWAPHWIEDDIENGWMRENCIFCGDYDRIFLLEDKYRGS